jgi:hypothetical protein
MTTEPWHLDKRIPIALIVTIALQTAMGVWWAAAITTRQGYLERRLSLHDAQIEAMRASATTSAVALGRIEETVIGLRADMNRLFEALQEQN